MSHPRPPRALLLATSAASVAAGATTAALATRLVHPRAPGTANLLFLLLLCAATLLTNSALARALHHYWHTHRN
ncbi:hypothetical protein [Kitasatospora sp. NPDC057500]|uniref:hypothetical protein n=1 Tax=Kitasatospora sp. NPDC057500 TaxID=3346151 RepID=UPI0036B6A200